MRKLWNVVKRWVPRLFWEPLSYEDCVFLGLDTYFKWEGLLFQWGSAGVILFCRIKKPTKR